MQLTKAIITAMKEEADIIIEKYNLKEIEEKSIPMGVKIFEGTRSSVDDWDEKIVLLLAGIWKVAATMATTYLFENYDVFKLINIGIAWNISDDDIKVWDVFIPNTFIKHDLHLPFDGDHLDYIKKPIFLESSVWENYDLQKFGLILNGVCLTGSQFIDDKEKQKLLREEHAWDIVEMEAFAILFVARAYGKLDKCIVIKAVSDWADNEAKGAHMDNLEFAMKNSVAVLEFVL